MMPQDKPPILVCGIERSGSTFVYQTLKHLGINVKKTHSYELGSPFIPKLYTFRDPRDVICSYARTVLLPEIQSGQIVCDDHPIGKKFPSEPLRVAAHRLFYSPATRQLDYRCYRWEADQGAPMAFIKYEYYFGGNELVLINDLSTFCEQFGYPKASEAQIQEVIEEYSIARNRERASKFASFEEWDDETQIHGDHISNNGESSWRDDFNFDVACHVDKFLGDFIIELGYENDREWKIQFFKEPES